MESGTPHNQGWLKAPQDRLGPAGLIVLITLVNIIMPFSTDIYMPAIPSLPEYFGTTEAVVNFTLIGFFLFMTISILACGPLSDRFGRKPVFVVCMATYTAGSVLCAASNSIEMLIAARIVQALGGGGAVAVSTALIKDCFVEDKREKMIALLQVMAVVGPVLAPLMGGFLLRFFSWRASFVALTLFGGISLALSLLFQESLPDEERRSGGISGTLAGLVRVARNRAFMVLLTMVALFNVSFMGYIAVSSYVYIDFFGTTPQEYTYFFAVTAVFIAMGPVLWIRISKHVKPRSFTHVLLGMSLAAGLLLLAMGTQSAFLFCAAMIMFTFAEAAIRPYTTNILLSQQEGDTGAASSLINFLYNIFGVLGMGLAVLPWPNYVFGLAVIVLTCTILSIALWVWLLGSRRMHIAELD